MRITDTGTSKIENANTRENRVTSTTKEEPEFTGPAKYSPFVPNTPVKNFTPTVFPTAKPSGLFVGPIPSGTVRTETGYVPEVPAGSKYSPGDFRKAEEKSNEPFYQQQQNIKSHQKEL